MRRADRENYVIGYRAYRVWHLPTNQVDFSCRCLVNDASVCDGALATDDDQQMIAWMRVRNETRPSRETDYIRT
jgi:hypothetical protein